MARSTGLAGPRSCCPSRLPAGGDLNEQQVSVLGKTALRWPPLWLPPWDPGDSASEEAVGCRWPAQIPARPCSPRRLQDAASPGGARGGARYIQQDSVFYTFPKGRRGRLQSLCRGGRKEGQVQPRAQPARLGREWSLLSADPQACPPRPHLTPALIQGPQRRPRQTLPCAHPATASLRLLSQSHLTSPARGVQTATSDLTVQSLWHVGGGRCRRTGARAPGSSNCEPQGSEEWLWALLVSCRVIEGDGQSLAQESGAHPVLYSAAICSMWSLSSLYCSSSRLPITACFLRKSLHSFLFSPKASML